MIPYYIYKEKTINELKRLDIELKYIEYPNCSKEALRLKYNNKQYIFINKPFIVDEFQELILIVHELLHIKLDKNYTSSASKYQIEQNERIINDAVIEFLELDKRTYDLSIDFYKRLYHDIEQYKKRVMLNASIQTTDS